MIYALLILRTLLIILTYMVILSIVLSWFETLRTTKFYRFLHHATDWYIGRFHDLFVIANVDLTPIVGIILLELGTWGIDVIIERLLIFIPLLTIL